MPIRFSTQAANADHIRVEAEPGVPEGMPDDIGADGTPRDRSDRSERSAHREPRGGASREERTKEAPAKPGKDINAPGFIKSKDSDKP